MHEDYVPYEAAKLLKEKGFEWRCHACYDYDKPENLVFLEGISNPCSIIYAAPAPYVAQKWLRETKSIHINIAAFEGNYYAVLFKTNGSFIKNMVKEGPNRNGIWESYEDALNAGILEALKLI